MKFKRTAAVAALMIGAVMVAGPALADDTEPVEPTVIEEVVTQTDPMADEDVPLAESLPIVEEGVEEVIETAPAPQLEVAEPIIEEPATLAAQTVQIDVDFVLALWKINAEGDDIWPGQTIADSVWLEDPSLSALDNSDALTCGTRYQVDLYIDDEVTTALLTGGVLNGPNNPTEHLASQYVEGNPWKYLTTEPCLTVTNSCVAGQGDTSTNLNDLWGNVDTRSAGHLEYVEGGLHIWTDDNSSNAKVSEGRSANFALKNTGTIGLNWTGSTPPPGVNLFVNFGADGNGTLVYESVYGQDLWLTNGSSAAVKAKAPSHTGGNGSENHGTIDEWLSVYPDATVTGIAYSLGSGVFGDGVIHSITVNCATYAFDYEEPVIEPTLTTPTVQVTDVCGVENDGFTTGEEDGITYSYDGERYLTATPDEGYRLTLDEGSKFTLNEDGTATFDASLYFTNEPCETTTPTPTVTPPTETPSATPSVTPTPVIAVTSSTPPLASTGSTVAPMVGLATLLIAAGVGLGLIAARRRITQ